jgi:hypothetical protein|tara:strand:- start:5687 stop:6871 length:1185 start_codon:yes stop_codon:yes gene_type:complete
MAVNVQGIGNALGAMGAGISGNMPAYMAAQAQEEKLRMEQGELRKQATFQDNRQMLTMASAGDFERPLQILGERVKSVTNSGGDPSHSLYMVDLIQSGQHGKAVGEMQSMDEIGVMRGDVPPQPGIDKYAVDQDGNMIGFTGSRQQNLGGNFNPSGGGVNVEITNPGSAATDEMSKALGKAQADEYGEILVRGNNAAESLQQLNAMQSLGDSTDTGVFQANKFAIAQYVDGLLGDGYSERMGLNVDVTGFQVFNSLTQQIVNAELRENKGIQTEGDAGRARQTAASLEKTPGANAFITANRRAIANRHITKSNFISQRMDPTSPSMAADYRRINQEWTQYQLDTPMIHVTKDADGNVSNYLFVNDFIDNLKKQPAFREMRRDELLEVWRDKVRD